jgi:hypothetical protein
MKKRIAILLLAATCMSLIPLSAAFAGTVYHGRDFSTIQTRSDGSKRLKVCDRERDLNEAGGQIERKNGTGGFYYDNNGADSGCGYSPWGKSGIVYHTVCEGGRLGSCAVHYHV